MSEHLFDEDDLKIFFRQQKEAIEKQKEAEKEAEKQKKEAEKLAERARKIQIKISHRELKEATPQKNPSYTRHYHIGQSILDFFLVLLRGVIIFVFIFIISFLIINYPAIFRNFKYSWDKVAKSSPNNQITPTQTDIMADNSLSIPKISVNAPIAWQVSENEILDKLQNGVASYTGTAMPGEQGNVFIFGHSSYYLWADGNYKSIFATLDNLENGDKIYLKYQNKIFTYQVTAKEVVNPDNLEVISNGNGKQLKLMTCVPIGTNLQRLIVTAIQI